MARQVDQIGSTAVPGLAAKPILDVQVSVGDPGDESRFDPALERLGCGIRGREPGHRMFRSRELDVHIHLWQAGGADQVFAEVMERAEMWVRATGWRPG